MVGILILIAIIILLIFFIFKKKNRLDKNVNSIFISGSLGTGKSFYAINKIAIPRFLKNLKKTKAYNRRLKIINLFRKLFKKELKEIKPLPQFYSNIPVKIKGYGYSTPLTLNHLIFKDKLIENSVIVIDELGSVASQNAYEDRDLTNNISELFRFFRQYVGNESLIIGIDQNSDRISLEIRRSLGAIYEFTKMNKILNIFSIKYIKYINFKQTDYAIQLKEQQGRLSGFIPFNRAYDDRAFSIRYDFCKNKNNIDYYKQDKQLLLIRADAQESNLDKIIKKEVSK